MSIIDATFFVIFSPTIVDDSPHAAKSNAPCMAVWTFDLKLKVSRDSLIVSLRHVQ